MYQLIFEISVVSILGLVYHWIPILIYFYISSIPTPYYLVLLATSHVIITFHMMVRSFLLIILIRMN